MGDFQNGLHYSLHSLEILKGELRQLTPSIMLLDLLDEPESKVVVEAPKFKLWLFWQKCLASRKVIEFR